VQRAPRWNRSPFDGDDGCEDVTVAACRVINCESLSKHFGRNGSMQPGQADAHGSDAEGVL